MTSTSMDRQLTEAQKSFMNLLATSALPVMAAPMFLVSGPDLVIACARAGIIGAYPAANARNIKHLRSGWPTPARKCKTLAHMPHGH